jgi:hypothetical protein
MASFLTNGKFSYLFIFLVGVILRAIPELMVVDYPIGYETITYYAPSMFAFGERGFFDVFIEFFRSGPLFYGLMWSTVSLNVANPFLILKMIGPLLYGILAVTFFLFLKRGLRFDGIMALVGVLLLVFQVATLRVSWDRFRNVLALIFIFATFTSLKSDYKFKWGLVGFFTVLAALSREYIALVLFVSVLGFAVLQRKERLVSSVSLAPALGTFFIMNFPHQLQNYITNSQYSWSGYLWTLQDAFIIFAICFLPLLPFAVKGFRRDELLEPMIGLFLLGSFSVVVSPLFVIPGYQRWLILLVFPFTIYAIKGFDRLRLFDRSNFRKLVAVLTVFLVLGVGYSSGALSYVIWSNSWIPTNLVQSSIGWGQIDDVKDVLVWLDENAEANSSILCEERFYGWTLIYLRRANNDFEVIPYGANSQPEPALKKALDDGFNWIYMIWYTDSNLENFKSLYSQNGVSLFIYEPQFTSLLR